ncbi:MAG: Malonyl CoA-acyl carrier protein transacylase [Chlamydiales bacterium]|nr:Malonyl CoA-acyl carrier protein transacylase [Chlamydiales bacterium]
MAKNIAFLFPGQGAQVVGMGKDFYERYTTAREIFQQGDELLNRSLTQIIFGGPAELLTETRNSQVGIYLNSLAILRVLQEQFPSLQPSICAGLSLGEYTALTASRRIPFEVGLPLVQFRGEAMNAACEATNGTMAALFGLSAQEVEQMIQELQLPNDLWVANFNCPGQTVISGTQKGVEAGIHAAKTRGAKRAIPLKVHGAFHSGLMRLAEEQLAKEIERTEILESPVQLIMNVSGNFEVSTDRIRTNMVKQVTSSVRWEQGVRAMMPLADLYIEIGCGRTLAGMNKQMGVQVPTVTINTIQDLDKLAEHIG